MPRLRRNHTVAIASEGAGTPARVRNVDRPQRVAKAIVADAHRGSAMVSNVEQHLNGVGATQLKTVITLMFIELAKALAVQRDTGAR